MHDDSLCAMIKMAPNRKQEQRNTTRATGVQSVRPTWFEDIAAPKDTTPQPNQDPQGQQPQPLHGLKLVIKEEVLPMKDQPKRAQVSLKATIDVPMLVHQAASQQEPDDMLKEYDMKRDSVEINHDAP